MFIGSFFRHLRVLMWKNATLKLRHWLVLILEIAIPAALMACLVGLKGAIAPKTSQVSYPATYWAGYEDITQMYSFAPCVGENLVWRCAQTSCTDSANFTGSGCESRMIAVAPYQDSDPSAVLAAQQFVTWVHSTYPETATRNTFRLFSSEQAFLDVLDNPDYSQVDSIPTYSTAIIFDHGYPNWQYQIRYNQSINIAGDTYNTPNTKLSALDLTLKVNTDIPRNFRFTYSVTYLYLGVYTIQDLVSSYASTFTCRNKGTCGPSEDIKISTLGPADFPNPKVTVNGFWSNTGYLFALVIIIAVLYPLANVISVLVKEKEGKLREGMLMMALRGDAYWVAWIINFLCLFFVISIVLTIVSQSLFEYSQPIYIFFYFFLFFMGSVSYCFFISSIFNKSRTATIIGVLVFFAGFFIYLGISLSSTTQPTRSSLLAAMLHPSTAFTYGTLAFAEWEDSNVGITENTWNSSNVYNITFQDCLNMLFVDFFLYGFLCWYFVQVFPSEFGTPKPFYFLILPSYWAGCGRGIAGCFGINIRPAIHHDYQSVSAEREIEMANFVEPVPENLASQVASNTCVDIRGLYKEFNTNTGVKVAVDHLSLTMYSGQITALLGHNGAGKTTAISMLTGLIPVDAGDAIVEGLSIKENLDEIRKNLGVCPQHDILYPDLTVQEHLILFASFKGCPANKLKEEVENMIQAVGLTEKRHVYAANLSGGQRRKLSVGNAFIGGSRIVFLDEPTSGMDPYSRRFTWNVIRQHREGRVIVLTTHFMDEADLLGDRIAIMGDGRLLCCGSSLFLKRIYGVGYNMTLEKADTMNFNSSVVENAIVSRIPDAKIITDVGAEMTVQLPFASSTSFESLFEYIDDNLKSLGVRSYGMSVTTLEEVFIKVAKGTNTQTLQENGRKGNSPSHSINKQTITPAEVIADVESKQLLTPEFQRIDPSHQTTLFLRHMYAMLLKRYLYFIRDTKSWFMQVALPVLFVLAGMIIVNQVSVVTEQSRITLNRNLYNTGISSNSFPFGYTNGNYFCPPDQVNAFYREYKGPITNSTCYPLTGQAAICNSITGTSNWPLSSINSAHTIEDTSMWLYNHREDYEASQYGSLSFIDIEYSNGHISEIYAVVHANYTAVHGGPLTAAYLGGGVVQYLDSSASLVTKLHPLPNTANEKKIGSNYSLSIVVIFLLLAIPMLPASWATYIVREREVKAKHVQLVSGVSVTSYWLATWIWDFAAYQFTLWGWVIILSAFPHTSQLSGISNGALGVTIGLLILFGSAMTGATYLFSFVFNSPPNAQIAFIFVVFVLGLLLTIVGLFLRIIPSTASIYRNGLRYFFCLFPPFALGDGLYNMAYIDIYSGLELGGSEVYSVHSWQISGLNLCFLGWETVFFLVATIAWEYLSSIPSFQALISPIKASSLPPTTNAFKDEDVINEELRVNQPEAIQSSTILVKDLRKMYPGGKYAVRGVSLGIPTGECFGLLGINGAGKSSLLAMLSGEIQPTDGTAYLAGLNLLTNIHECRRKIGFCPQFDALFELLSAREHLELYARIKGIAESDINNVVNHKIAELGLTEYADRAAGTYSGGNKRKLSVAIAMIGEPDIVFLDEPSTGMDPVARRFMWEVITNIVTKRESCSMILTTHSMEECEALCTRIGIMVGGALRCLGSSQRLRSRYGSGYQLEFGFTVPPENIIQAQVSTIVDSLGLSAPAQGADYKLTMANVQAAIASINRSHWSSRISSNGTASDLYNEIVNVSYINARSFASWVINENNYDRLIQYLTKNYPGFEVRERQVGKVRVVIPDVSSDGQRRKLSTMFGSVEKHKEILCLEEYSISQTSLEQIFNHFASQQEEETGHAAGLIDTVVVNASASLHAVQEHKA